MTTKKFLEDVTNDSRAATKASLEQVSRVTKAIKEGSLDKLSNEAELHVHSALSNTVRSIKNDLKAYQLITNKLG